MLTLEDLNLPSVLYTPDDADDQWVKTKHANWHHLQAALVHRQKSAQSVMEDADRFGTALDMLRPLMELHPSLTVAEALMALTPKADR